MFSNSVGFQIRDSNFYNVGGDVNLQLRQHLTTQDHHAVELERGGDAGIHQQPAIEVHGLQEPGFQPAVPTLGLIRHTARSEPEWAGVVRNKHHGMAAKPAPYGALKVYGQYFNF
jgi:hypothetical protein